MPKEIRLNAFLTFAPTHLSPGLWAHPQDRSLNYNTLSFWTDLARTAERGGYDALFFADGISQYDVYGGSNAAGVRLGLQFPRLDPLLLVPAMAQATEHLGFAVTSSTSYEPPYLFARRMSTLDHLTQGRVGWNIVTSFGDSGARALGQAAARPHDERYDVADEYLDVVYRLWEQSWEDGAARRDRQTRVFADPSRVHEIQHRGRYFEMQATHYSEPSPQRTPVLYQAGTSRRGKDFAARHAEAVFLSTPTAAIARRDVHDIRQRAIALGRAPEAVQFFSLATVVVAPTSAQAQDKWRELQQHVSLEGALALFSRWIGVDLSKYHPDDPLRYLQSEGMQSTMEGFTLADPDRVWTIGELAVHNAIGGKGPVFVGSAAEVADALQAWIAESDVDGFNLSHALLPGTHEDFVTLVVPELQRRGVYKTAYRPGTLREKLYGQGPLLDTPHPAAGHRAQAAGTASPAHAHAAS
ncbi:LLM class flavin-dependent oxidoreductase [Bordetella genomosp. 12]|uniref:5,10-methylene tetrahydromethanopterin reductase n=1 Tax=Bordetella genomosp. 12 TaxID=463035 RepID=A0A261VD50_9BORD|nr:LLM class flavin-dependent oxidoreductase [Bordetella genomosp. 12]OZI71935.1 5,10-methylene tetrahydromethanopterin reductase [Bordetella genomosp. 12]